MHNPSSYIVIIAILSGCIPITAEIVTPGNHPIPPDHHALTNAKVIIKPGTTLNDATVVINKGRIISVTENGKPPKTARIWNMSGHTIYAGFIDSYVTNVKPISTTMTQRISGNEATATGKPGFLARRETNLIRG